MLAGAGFGGEGLEFGAAEDLLPPTLVRVIPNGVNVTTLGRPGTADVFVTVPEDIAGMNSAEIALRLSIPESPTGYRPFTATLELINETWIDGPRGR